VLRLLPLNRRIRTGDVFVKQAGGCWDYHPWMVESAPAMFSKNKPVGAGTVTLRG